MRDRIVYRLSDGKDYTAMEVSESTGINIKTIRDRLNSTTRLEAVFAAVNTRKRQACLTKYTLSDGTAWTVDEIMAHSDITRSAAWARVHASRDVKKVLAGKFIPKVDTDLVVRRANSMINDPDGFWKAFNSMKLST